MKLLIVILPIVIILVLFFMYTGGVFGKNIVLDWRLPWVPPVPKWWTLLPYRWNVAFGLGIPIIIISIFLFIWHKFLPQNLQPHWLDNVIVIINRIFNER